MNLKATNNVETNKYQLQIEVTPEEFNKTLDAVFKSESKKLNIPGFRKGKAPRAFVEKYYGEEVFFDAAVDRLYRSIVMEAIDQSKLEVVSIGDFKIDEISKAAGVQCTLTVVTKPEASIEGYKGIEVTREPVVVTEGDINSELERVRERNSRMITVEGRAAENGDIAVIDFDGYVDDKQFDGGQAENYELTLGAGQFIRGFEDQIVGHSTGEDFDVNVTFPEDYHAEELKGKAAVFKIKLHELKTKELPEVDDEFVKDVSEFDTLEEYKKDIEKKLLERREKAADADVENQLIDAVIEKVQAEIPDEMVENEVDEIINAFAQRLQSQGLKLETYLQYTNMTTDDLRAQYKPQADRQVKVRLGLEKIAQLEGIKPTDEECEEELKRLSEAYGMPLENVKGLVNMDMVSADLANQKAVEFVRANAVIKEPEAGEE
ncbi:trigger factor [Neglecta sp. X4]|uniref:trigger factor n=1 Tax=unclassified Neglectibacter TaxID=2632164 RepID=UPI00136B3100|nr:MULTISPECIES: trigger factor [unclassified Neglectibacter]NBI16334.1 trigger factor [Neglectibacter sp. 59]NBJ72032.1 trigger factor [Neglectibacter sp. X4]NCE79808.1 trigger factor [Neglectibacter sp. X58]